MAPEIDSYAKVPAGYAYAGCTTSTQKKAVKWAIRCRLIDPDTFNAGKCPKRSTSYALVRKAVNIFMPEIEGFDLKNGSSKNVDLSKKTLKDKQVLSRLGIANTSTMKAGYLSKTDATRMSNNIKKIKSSLYTTATPEPTAIEPELTTPAPTAMATPVPEQEETVVKTTTTPTPEPTTTPAPEPTTTPVPPTSTPEPEDFTSSIEEDYIKVQTWLEENGYETKYKNDEGVIFCSDAVTPASRVVYEYDIWTILIEYSDGYKKIKRIQSDENIMSYLEMIKEYTPAAH